MPLLDRALILWAHMRVQSQSDLVQEKFDDRDLHFIENGNHHSGGSMIFGFS